MSNLQDTTTTAAELKVQVDQMRQKLSNLVQICNSTAVECDKMSVIQDVRASFLSQCYDKLRKTQSDFHTFYESEHDGGILPSLSIALHDTFTMSKISRFQLALQAFRMHRIDVGNDNSNTPKQQSQQPRGIGKIAGLPLPHAGPVLYSCLPPEVLTSALRLVASLTHTLSRILGITLPHPILLHTPINSSNNTTITHSQYWNHHCDIASIPLEDIRQKDGPNIISRNNKTEIVRMPAPPGVPPLGQNDSHYATAVKLDDSETVSNSSSLLPSSSLSWGKEDTHAAWSVRRSITKAATGAISRAGKLLIPMPSSSPLNDHSVNVKTSSNHHATPISEGRLTSPLLRMDSHAIQQRIRYGTATFIQESSCDVGGLKTISGQERKPQHRQATEYELSATTSNNSEEFTIGLQLLQNDIVALCVHSGVPISTLWPAEAILLNLNALRVYCGSQVDNGGIH